MHLKNNYKDITENFIRFLDIIPEPVYWLDNEQNLLGSNSAAIKASGTTSIKDILSTTAPETYHHKIAKEVVLRHQKVIKTGEIISHEEFIAQNSTGQVRAFNAVVSPLYDKKDNIIGTFGISLDITERKNLEKLVKQKNKEIAEKEATIQSKDELKKAFIKNFIHDVKSPIHNIINKMQILQKLTEGQAELNYIIKNYNYDLISLNKMFDHLYSVMINDEFNNSSNNKNFDFHDMADLEIALTKSSITIAQDIKISMILDDKIPSRLHGDAFKTSQILRSILSNSVKYTKAGEIKLIAEVLEDTKDTIKIKFTIADTGSGITPTDKNKVYEYGRRFITSYETNVPAAGIGLNIAKQYVDALGGTIDFESTIGKGTDFFVELNFKKVQPD